MKNHKDQNIREKKISHYPCIMRLPEYIRTRHDDRTSPGILTQDQQSEISYVLLHLQQRDY